MKCPICNGKGYQFVADYDGMYDIVCEQCKGKGELDENGKPILTNEEYLKSCTTEQLAELLDKMTLSCYICGQDGYNENPRHCIFGRCTGKEDIFEWLKKPHKE